MCKGFTLRRWKNFWLFTSLNLLSWLYLPASAQIIGTGSFRDGAPTFIRVDRALTQNVRVDSVVSLSPQATSLAESDTFRVLLSGIDERYTKISPPVIAAEDVDKIQGQNFYLITDAIGRKIYLIDAETQANLGDFGGTTAGTPEFLEKPVDAFPYFKNNFLKILITDQGRHRILHIDWLGRRIEWQYGGTQGSGTNQLSAPSDAVILSGSPEALICDTGNNRIVVIDTTRKVVTYSFGNGNLNMPVDVEEEPATGLFLITDQNNHRVILVQRSTSTIVWQFGTTGRSGSADNTLNTPTDADVLPNGNILISDAGNKRLIEVDRQSRRIVYRFAHPLSDLRDADRLTEAIPDRDKTLVVASNPPTNQNLHVVRLAYKNETFLSAARDFSRSVNYDSLKIRANLPAGTNIRVQLRSANVLADLLTAPWLGPTGTGDSYTAAVTAINPAHDGDRFYQFRAFLETTSPLATPVLLGVEVKAHFFDTGITGILTSEVIRDPTGMIITSWQSLIFNTILAANPAVRDQVSLDVCLLDEQGQNVLQCFAASIATADNIVPLSSIESLRRRQAVRLQARLKTNNSSVTPRLNDWRVDWQNTASTRSSIRFTNANNEPVSFYRVQHISEDPPLIGTVFVTLEDANLIPIESAVNLQITARRSGDVETALLTARPTGQYTLSPGLPAIIANVSAPGDGRLYVHDRDTLLIRYVDPTDPTDVSSARVHMIRLVSGRIRIEKPLGTPVDTVSVGDTLFVRVIDETDRSISSQQDSVVATLFNNSGLRDRERLILHEVRNDTSGVFDTGEFVSRIGIPILNLASIENDGFLQVRPGDQILAEFIDNTTLQRIIASRSQPADTNIFILAGSKPFDFFVAPNPYNTRKGHNRFTLAAVANSGDMIVQHVEIYNLAGEKVRSISGEVLRFGGQTQIKRRQPAFAENWWDFRTDDGSQAAAGTYWAKFYVRLTDPDTGRTQDVTSLRKFVFIR